MGIPPEQIKAMYAEALASRQGLPPEDIDKILNEQMKLAQMNQMINSSGCMVPLPTDHSGADMNALMGGDLNGVLPPGALGNPAVGIDLNHMTLTDEQSAS